MQISIFFVDSRLKLATYARTVNLGSVNWRHLFVAFTLNLVSGCGSDVPMPSDQVDGMVASNSAAEGTANLQKPSSSKPLSKETKGKIHLTCRTFEPKDGTPYPVDYPMMNCINRGVEITTVHEGQLVRRRVSGGAPGSGNTVGTLEMKRLGLDKYDKSIDLRVDLSSYYFETHPAPPGDYSFGWWLSVKITDSSGRNLFEQKDGSSLQCAGKLFDRECRLLRAEQN